jgi:hypothetical protein
MMGDVCPPGHLYLYPGLHSAVISKPLSEQFNPATTEVPVFFLSHLYHFSDPKDFCILPTVLSSLSIYG